jgi:hypothetical protein
MLRDPKGMGYFLGMPKNAPIPRFMALAFLICAFAALPVRAEDPPEAPTVASPAVATDTTAALADPLLPDRLSPGEKLFWGENGLMRGSYPLTEEGREQELGLRRTLLNLHQVGGFMTLAAMLATAFAGQMIVNGEESFEKYKAPLAYTTVGLYFTTATFALLAPPPVVRRPGFSSITLHKTLAWVHFSGMLLTPLTGRMIEGERSRQLFHQTAGYVTTAAFAGAMVSVTFF